MLILANRFIDVVFALADAESLGTRDSATVAGYLTLGFPTGSEAWPALMKTLYQRQIDVDVFAERYRLVRSLYDHQAAQGTSPKGGQRRRKGRKLPSSTEGALPRNSLNFAPVRE